MAIVLAKKSSAATVSSVKQAVPSGGLPWMKKGQQAKQVFQEEEARAEKARQEQGKLWRFFIGEGEEKLVTFLDGALDEDGMLNVPLWYEHRVYHNGNWQTFVCVASDTQPCPICEAGDKHRLVGALTVIDHTEYTIRKGPNQGKVIKDTKKLYVAGRNTLKILAKLASKQGGSLAGCGFEISRQGDKSPGVGDLFQFSAKNDPAELREHFGKDDKGNWVAEPADYEKEITYLSAEELVKLGVGKAVGQIGSENGIDKDELAKNL